MLYPVLQKLQHKRLVLASASPRRQEILSQAGVRFEVVPSRFNEKLDKASFSTPYAYAIETAKEKALEVTRRMYQKDLRAPDMVIGADTIVTVDGLILEKPVDKQHAYRMLSRLNGKEHSVFTGVAIIQCFRRDGRLDLEVSEFYEETTVTFSELSEELLWEYIHSGEPMDKAGGYGIQALGGMLVECVRGDFLNVVGFPLNRFCKMLSELHGPPPRPRGPPDAPETLGQESAVAVDARGARAPDPGGARRSRNGDRDTEPPAPFPTGLLELIAGFKASKALFTACKLQVFEVLRDAGPLKAVEVAGKIAASEAGTARLLDACVALGLLQEADGRYANSELAARHLLSDSELSLLDFIRHQDEQAWAAFTHLEAAVRTGTGPREEPRLATATHGFTKLVARQVATAFDLSRFASACHLGGCTGALARELAQEYPGLKVTVFDLPEVIEHVAGFQPAAPQTERVSSVPGGLAQDSLPEADLYVLSGILHDWPDDRVHELLSRVSGSCKPGGGLLVAQVAAPPGLLRALSRLLPPTRGRARGAHEYRQMLRRHGFTDVRVAHTRDVLHVLLATRAAP